MAVSDNDDPVLEEYSSAEARVENSMQYPSSEFRGNLVTVSSDTPLHRMHEDHVVRPAGRMVMGSPAPIPTLDDVLKETPMFSGRKPRRLGAIGTLAIAMACAFAIVAAVGLTGVLNKNTVNNPPRKTAIPATPATPPEKNRSTEKFVAGQVVSNTPQARPEPIPPVKESTPVEQPVVARMETPQQRLIMDTQSNFSVKSIAGFAGDPLPVEITLPSAQPEEYSFVMFRGLPPEISMSAGFRLKGSWVVSLRDLQGLVIQSQLDFEGKFGLEVMLIKGRDVPAENRTIVVSIEKRTARAPNTSSAEDVLPAPAQNVTEAKQAAKIEDRQPARAITRERVAASAGGTSPTTSRDDATQSEPVRTENAQTTESTSKQAAKTTEPAKPVRSAITRSEPAPVEAPAAAPAQVEPESAKVADTRAPAELAPAEVAPDEVASAEPAPSGAAAMPTISPEEEGPLLERAAQFLEKYDVANARLLFEHLARSGSSKGALALGQTYDPTYFQATEIRGMKPDVAKAKEWYKKAAELGNQEANKRLSALATP
jgi:hypothetical protein